MFVSERHARQMNATIIPRVTSADCLRARMELDDGQLFVLLSEIGYYYGRVISCDDSVHIAAAPRGFSKSSSFYVLLGFLRESNEPTNHPRPTIRD